MHRDRESDTAWARGSAELARRDKVIAHLVRELGTPRLGALTDDPFATLVRAIVQQQLAAPAARAIHSRLTHVLDGSITPESVASAADPVLRGAGLSSAKVASLKDLAAKTRDGTVRLALDELVAMTDAQIAAELTTVRGIGAWTADMFLMFQLHRIDIWPFGDLALRRGVGSAWHLTTPTPPTSEGLR
ncbi:DNA-3-methyladenine glycosylase 2 family protein [Mycobacteroides franklinii]|uniref:DNA-3-methyladenine glycosylase 2 family protein n=1 Tax=Mycobacteroides franklinii TaxID=948102 RepID=UPI0013E8E632